MTVHCSRYDGRGHLYDLRPFDAEFVESQNFMLTDREKALENACDEERYLELNSDVLTKQMYEGINEIFFKTYRDITIKTFGSSCLVYSQV